MQTELARLSLFMSLAGYLILFSDVFFENGYPNFSELLGHDTENSAPPAFFFSPTSKWQMVYFGLAFLMFGRLIFSCYCPERLKEHGFRKIDFVQSCQRLKLRSFVDEMLNRVAPKDEAVPDYHEFQDKRSELTELLFPKYDPWARALYEQRQTNAWKSPENTNNQPLETERKHRQEAALADFFSECLEQDYELAICDKRFWRVASIMSGLLGYILLALPAVDLMLAILRDLGGS